MDSHKNPAPAPVPVPSETASTWRDALLLVTDEFEAPPVILRVEDSVISTLGNFSASTGKAKSKKTFNVCAIVAAAMMCGTVLNYSASLPPGKRRVLYADTEQSEYHCNRVISRILRLAGLSADVHPDGLVIPVPAEICDQRTAENDRAGHIRNRRPRSGHHRRHP